MNNTKVNRVSLAYKRMSAPSLVTFIGWIVSCLDGNTSFPNPPVPLKAPAPPDPDAPVDMTTRMTSLQTAIAAAEGGGKALTAAKDAAFQFALDGLDALAFYVQTVARYDLAMFLTSGFQVVSNNHGQSPLDAPTVAGIDNDVSTQLDVHLTPITNAYGYEVQTMNGTGGWTTARFSSQARSITLTGLTTGQVYQVRARALGGSTGQSDWSAPSSKIVD